MVCKITNLIFLILLCFSVNKALSNEHNIQKIPILGFHDIINLNSSQDVPPLRREFDIDYTKEDLKKIIVYLIQNNYYFIDSIDLYNYFILSNKKLPKEYINKKPVMLSFDDGYIGIKNNLLPLLQEIQTEYKIKIKVVLFINSGLMGIQDQDIKYMSCNDLKDLFNYYFFDIQSHGLSHKKLIELNQKELQKELALSKKDLQKCIKNKLVAQNLAYPYGEYNDKVIKYAKNIYLTAYSYNNKIFDITKNVKYTNKKYKIDRLHVYREITPEKLFLKLN